jgi:hypothetical protein
LVLLFIQFRDFFRNNAVLWKLKSCAGEHQTGLS